MNNCVAVLIDTVSIQEYIFSSNKLKDNIGASFIVDNIYKDQLKRALEIVFKASNININTWRENPDIIQITQNKVEFEVGYIGGGNALILFKEGERYNRVEKAKEFVRTFTKMLLEEVPGVKTAFGIAADFNLDKFEDSMKKLHKELQMNKNKFFSLVTLQKHGFTLDCPRTDESAEFDKKDEEESFISAVAKAKIEVSKKARERMKECYLKNYENEYLFTDEIDKLGQQKNSKNYIAIVHIDGNKIGEKFKKCESLQEIRKLSIDVENASQSSFKRIIEEVVDKIKKKIISKENGFYLSSEDEKTVLPLIPVLIAGDEVTFVCEGRLGIWLAEKYIKELMNYKIQNSVFSACAGVSIVKSKYPFYRAYLIAEGLLSRAKRKSRENGNSSYLDFFVSSGGCSGEIDDILEKHFSTINGNLHFGPYKVDSDCDTNCYNDDSLKYLKENIKGLLKFPRNKLMRLREALFEEKEIRKLILEEFSVKDLNLPKLPFKKDYITDLWENKKTPYFDAIEAIDFYPEGLLNE